MLRTLVLSKAVLLAALLIASCSPKTEDGRQAGGDLTTAVSYKDFAGRNIGVASGTICDRIAVEHVKAAPVYYSDMSAGLDDLRKGRIDGYLTDLSITRTLVSSPGNRDFQDVEIPAELFFAPMGAISASPELIAKFNAFLGALREDGTLAEMQDRWLRRADLDTPLPRIPLTGENGTLKIATDATKIPFAFMGRNYEFAGYSMELIKRFAAHEGFKLQIRNMGFGEFIPSVINKSVDMAIANISITEERRKLVLFSESIYDDQFGIIALKKSGGVK